ncbi:poly(ADP-ribose) glycohydrolase [Microdochium nivale]|nr:poly(ADP-ribose) glycohydrolase [Microdochium nivale]
MLRRVSQQPPSLHTPGPSQLGLHHIPKLHTRHLSPQGSGLVRTPGRQPRSSPETAMAHATALYPLPCSPTQRCLDRFSILQHAEHAEDQDGQVPVWQLVRQLLDTSPVADGTQLVDLLETIAVTLRGSTGPAGDYGLLRSMVDTQHVLSFFDECWPRIRSLALSMPELFPAGTLPVLASSIEHQPATGPPGLLRTQQQQQGRVLESVVVLSRQQVACLVAHQFLCTMGAPLPRRSDYFDFSIWFGSDQRHPEAARIYLTTLFEYFSSDSEESGAAQGNKISYCLRTLVPDQPPLSASHHHHHHNDAAAVPLSPMRIHQVSEYDTTPASLGLPCGAAVVSANRTVGFGESATHEEIHVGSSPEACPAVLVAPGELGDSQVFVVRGARAVSNIVGQRRDIHLGRRAVGEGGRSDSSGDGAGDDIVDGVTDWTSRTMLFMDALELDSPEQYRHDDEDSDEDYLPDLIPRNMGRELIKAHLAFSSSLFSGAPYEEIVSPLWGCGAFNGDPFVKALLLWIAASTTVTKSPALRIVCDASLGDTADKLRKIIRLIGERYTTVGELRACLLDAMPRNTRRLETGDWLLEKLSPAS